MVSFKEFRELLILLHANNFVSHAEFVLLYDTFTSKNPDFPYNSYEQFNLDAMNAAESSTTVYFAYAFIGLRKTCRHCTFHWTDNEPFTYANWYGSEPNTYYYDCAHIRTLSYGFQLSYWYWF